MDSNALREAEERERYYSPRELKEILSKIYIPNRWPFMIKSAPGCGKSDIISQVAADVGYDLIISHPVIDDPIDYKGMPAVINEKAVFLPYANMEMLRTATRPTLYVLEDFGQAAPAVQKPCMQLLLVRQINGMKVSEYVTFGAATNRKVDKAGVSGVLEPVKSRFKGILGLRPDADSWNDWAMEHNMPVSLMAFVKFREDLLLDFKPTMELENSSCPRTIAAVGEIQNANPPERYRYRMFADAAGTTFAAGYTEFLSCFDSLIDLAEVFKNPMQAPIPNETRVQWFISGILAKKATPENIGAIIQYAQRLRDELHVFIVTAASKINEKVVTTPAYIAWLNRNQRMLKGKSSFGQMFN